MISHKLGIIFVHVPKCAGSSIRDYYFNKPKLDWRKADYNMLYGWCPKRNIHLQHATPKELIETELISEEVWNSYFKFAIVRNPWDRAYSDYLWVQKDRRIKDSFYNYIGRKGEFSSVMNDKSSREYRGDHLAPQVEYVADRIYRLDYIGRFETLVSDIGKINEAIGFDKGFDIHEKKSSGRVNHYSKFYTSSKKQLVDEVYKTDIEELKYTFEDKKRGLYTLKKYF